MLRVIKGGGAMNFVPSCSVAMEDKVEKFTDFVTIGWDNEKDTAVLTQNADAITLGQACRLILNSFNESYGVLSDEDKLMVDEALNIAKGGLQ